MRTTRSERVLSIASEQTRPLIAVTTSEVRRSESVAPTPQGEPPRHEMALGLKYLQALEDAGGIPLVVPPLSTSSVVDALLDRVDALCLSGGPDLDPQAYNERRHERTGPIEPDLDEFEFAVAKAADERGMPILAICRGLQVLNVARGGTLHQHLPDVVGVTINHRQPEPGPQPTHSVTISRETRIADILGREDAQVNSFHHQAIARLGRGLVVTSRAPDGTIESIEATDREFVLGVQWHAETLVARPEQAALFRAFVAEARRVVAGAPQLRVA
ncbi:MAG: putative glutamine amidotransferase [Solirubrobacteraceae bacterium]|nr:putative glutamine amidotransferase [Solirubrobacteraceae bacterium]